VTLSDKTKGKRLSGIKVKQKDRSYLANFEGMTENKDAKLIGQ